MTTIQKFRLKNFNNNELTTFMRVVERLMKANLPAAELDVIRPMCEAIDVYVDAMRDMSERFGEQIREADAAVDKAWVVMHAQVAALSEHPIASVRIAAGQVLETFDRYPNPTGLPYAEEYGIMEKLLRDLQELPTAMLEKVMLDTWVVELAQRIERFNELMHAKTESRAATDFGATKRARMELESEYQAAIAKLNALLILRPDEVHVKMANEINTYIDSRRSVQRASKTRAAAVAEVNEPDKEAVESVEDVSKE